jgi:predicted DsbA family dithiol-disulfide isomerase
MAAFKAYLVEEQNIALKEVLLNLVESVDLSSVEAVEVIEKRLFSETVEKEWAQARQLNLTAVPTLVLGNQRLVGAVPYEQIVQFVKNGNA